MPTGLDGNPEPISSAVRDGLLDEVAQWVMERRVVDGPLLVAVDGIDGAGKTTFADELAPRLIDGGANVVRSTIDWFHNPRALRYAKGRTSPVGFYLDSHNLAALRDRLLDPFRSGAGSRYQRAFFDEPNDRRLDEPWSSVHGDEVLVFDGIFLSRPELQRYWDVVIFLDAQERVDLTRLGLVLADAPAAGVELIAHTLMWADRIDRYASGMRYYLDTVNPMAKADLVIDNNNLSTPFLVGAD